MVKSPVPECKALWLATTTREVLPLNLSAEPEKPLAHSASSIWPTMPFRGVLGYLATVLVKRPVSHGVFINQIGGDNRLKAKVIITTGIVKNIRQRFI